MSEQQEAKIIPFKKYFKGLTISFNKKTKTITFSGKQIKMGREFTKYTSRLENAGFNLVFKVVA